MQHTSNMFFVTPNSFDMPNYYCLFVIALPHSCGWPLGKISLVNMLSYWTQHFSNWASDIRRTFSSSNFAQGNVFDCDMCVKVCVCVVIPCLQEQLHRGQECGRTRWHSSRTQTPPTHTFLLSLFTNFHDQNLCQYHHRSQKNNRNNINYKFS